MTRPVVKGKRRTGAGLRQGVENVLGQVGLVHDEDVEEGQEDCRRRRPQPVCDAVFGVWRGKSAQQTNKQTKNNLGPPRDECATNQFQQHMQTQFQQWASTYPTVATCEKTTPQNK